MWKKHKLSTKTTKRYARSDVRKDVPGAADAETAIVCDEMRINDLRLHYKSSSVMIFAVAPV